VDVRSRVVPQAGPFLETTEAGEALFLFLRAHRVLFDGVDRAFRKRAGLSLALWEVLVVLSKAPELRLRMADITRRMLVSKSNVTQLIDRLVEAGMVTRLPSPSDRRLVYAALTDHGIESVKRGGDVFNDAAREHLGRFLTATDARKVGSTLAKVISAHAPEGLD
jgi:DNA-binding MarR family transcriptional regulator